MAARQLGFRVAAAALGLVIGGALVEAGLRLSGTLPQATQRMTYAPSGPFEKLPHPPFIAYRKNFEGNQIYFSCTSAGCGEDRRISFRTNSMRMRDFAHALEKPPNAYRVLVLGDSFSVADGVDRMQAWPQVLGASLDQTLEVKRVEVINTSMQAYSTLDQWHVLQHAIRFEPDLIVIGIYLNDAMPSTTNWSVRGVKREDQGIHWERLQSQTGAIGPWLPTLTASERAQTPDAGLDHPHFLGNVRTAKHFTQPLAILQWADALSQGRTQRADTIAAVRAWWGPWNELGRMEFNWSVSQLGRVSSERGVPVVALIFPWMDGLHGDYPFVDIHDQIHQALDAAGIPYADMLSPYRAAATQGADLWAHPTDHHPSAAMHAIAAEQMLSLVTPP